MSSSLVPMTINSKDVIQSSNLPSINLSQKLYDLQLPKCSGDKPESCCLRDLELEKWYKATPTILWDTATNYQGGPGISACTEQAFARQCMLSQYYTYLSKNNSMPR